MRRLLSAEGVCRTGGSTAAGNYYGPDGQRVSISPETITDVLFMLAARGMSGETIRAIYEAYDVEWWVVKQILLQAAADVEKK